MKLKWIAGSFVMICTIIIGVLFMNYTQNDTSLKEKNNKVNQSNSVIKSNDILKKTSGSSDAFIYFYKPNCIYCTEAHDDIYQSVKDSKVNLESIDLDKEENATLWDELNIKGTPTIIHFKDSKEIKRIEGAVTFDEFNKFFSDKLK
ncbi:thioredoxin family protein [Bacillus sp. AR18-7]|uniref:thioredoxin family protein n=1 Tax=Bacillus sp. AR18-7 TaxID=2217821 RepID=UPI0011CC6339|nr:thioredoxin family protein [Bacillus sp. AR18-7]TXR64499.1 thioredoxin [Bacillus sp. AR18-7]